MTAISVYLTVSGWRIEQTLDALMATRSRYATATVGTLRAAGYELVATGRAPHYSLVLPAAMVVDAERLLAHFGPTLNNEYRARR